MGAGCSDANQPMEQPSYIYLDGTPQDVYVESNTKRSVTLKLRREDQEKLLAIQENQRKKYLKDGMNSTLSTNTNNFNNHSSTYNTLGGAGSQAPIIEVAINIEKGMLLRVYITVGGNFLQYGHYIGNEDRTQEKSTIKLPLFASKTNQFQPDDYQITLVGSKLPTLVHVSAHVAFSNADPNDPNWLRDIAEKMELENEELRRRMRAQSEVIARLKARLSMYESDIDTHKQKFLDERQKRVKVIIERWRMKTQVPFFLEWKRTAREIKERRILLLGKVVNRLGNAQLWRAFRQWKQQADGGKVGDLRRQLMEHKGKIANRLIEAWRNKSLTPVFQEWKRVASRRRLLLGKVVNRMQNGLVWRAFRQWKQSMEQGQVQDLKKQMMTALAEEKRKRALALINAWRQKSMVSVFQEWKNVAQRGRLRREELIGKVVKRLAHSGLWKGFRAWKEFITNLKMKDFTIPQDDGTELTRLKIRLKEEKLKRAKHMIAMWRLKSCGPVFLEWRKVALGGKDRKKALLAKIVARMQKAPLWRAFRQWKTASDEMIRRDLEHGLAGARGIEEKYKLAMQELMSMRSRFDEIKTKFVVTKARKKRYQLCYEKLLSFFRTFRIEVATRLERDMRPFCSRKCRCDVCTMKARSTVELVMDMLLKFDSDFELRSLLRDINGSSGHSLLNSSGLVGGGVITSTERLFQNVTTTLPGSKGSSTLTRSSSMSR